METHRIHPELLERQVRVLVVGCGGSGSAVVAGLPYLQQSLVARGHPGGLHVTVVDGDTISPTNCIRQPFAKSEVGLNKAIVLVNRLNLFWGLKWEAVPAHLKPGTFISRSYSGDALRAHIVVGCVDTRAARAAIRDAVGNWSTVSYWLDLGNNADSGQFILGEPLNERNRRSKLRLRTAGELFPEIVDPTLNDEGQPSCSAAAALERQEPFINSTLAQHALALLARLFRYSELSNHGGFINLATGTSSVLRIDPQCWKRTRSVSTGLKGSQFHRFGGSHSAKKYAFGHTKAPAGSASEILPRSNFGRSQRTINANRYPPAHPRGETMLKRGALGGYRGSILWPGRGRSQRTRDPIGR